MNTKREATSCIAVDSVTVVVTPCAEICGDGIDNDLDKLIDEADEDCYVCTGGLLTNGGFESGLALWTTAGAVAVDADAVIGSNAATIGDVDVGFIKRNVFATAGETFNLKFYAKNTGNANVTTGLRFIDTSNNVINFDFERPVENSSYDFYEITATAPANVSMIQVFVEKGTGTGNVYVDEFCLTMINDICGGGGEPNFDNDPICDRFDLDDDNDGIKDVDEFKCSTEPVLAAEWTHNYTPGDSGVNFLSGRVDSIIDEYIATGLMGYEINGYLGFADLDQDNLTTAMFDNDYLEYGFATADTSKAMYLSHFEMTKHGDNIEAKSYNFGYDFSVLISDDNFTTSTLIEDLFTVDPAIHPDSTLLKIGADDNQYLLLPSKTYKVRIYFYNKITTSRVDAWFDDFRIFVKLCNEAVDRDADGIVNRNDLDSDNDGILDSYEAGHGAADADSDGIIDGADTGSGRNGLFNGVETFDQSGIYNFTLSDSEGTPDGIYDFFELDSDGDTCFDAFEAHATDPDEDGIAGTGVPVVDTMGRVTTIIYSQPVNNRWQDPAINECILCKTAIINPQIMFYKRN